MKGNSIIQLQNINHTFGKRQILNDFNLTVNKGEKYLFSAPSGFGKSTVFNMIMGFIEPDSGDVIIDGVKICDDNVNEIRSKIAYLPQSISLPNISIKEFVDTVTNFSQNNFDFKDFMYWVGEVDLPDNVMDSRLFSLSGGEKQRLMLCICLAMNKPILLIDEGLTGVDNARMQKVLTSLSADKNLTIIYISHDTTHERISGFKKLEVG